jgi:NAD(P)-dependent dehydrogenase (short-subunit alcohol dehydrogenase family)
MFELNNRTALVTGAATGLGQAAAVALTKAGAKVAISDRPGESLAETASLCADCGHSTYSVEIDVRDIDQIRTGVAAVESEFGHIDILVSNAGINRPMPGLDVDQENWDDHFNTNIRGGFFCA